MLLDNRKFFIQEDVLFSYSNIEINSNGFKIINPEFIVKNYSETTQIKANYISLNLSLAEVVYMLEGLMYREEISKINTFNLVFDNTHILYNNIDSSLPYSESEVSIDNVKIEFDGYINQKIIADMDEKERIPNINQSLEISLRGMNTEKLNALCSSDYRSQCLIQTILS